MKVNKAPPKENNNPSTIDPNLKEFYEMPEEFKIMILRTLSEGWDVARWYSACLACVRS
jgi:hypothetical protein